MKTVRLDRKITDADAAACAPDESGDYLLSGNDTPGFFLKVGKREKSWIVRRKFHGTTRTLTIGTQRSLTVDTARKAARRALSDLENGIHPKDKVRDAARAADEKKAAAFWTLATAFDWYTAASDEDAAERLKRASPETKPFVRKKPLSELTVKGYRIAKARFEKAGIAKMPIGSLDPDILMTAHASMVANCNVKRAKAGGTTQAAQAMRYARAAVRACILSNLPETDDPFAAIPRGRKWSEPMAHDRTIIDRDGSLAKWWSAVENLREGGDGRSKDAATVADWLQLTLLFGCRRSETMTMTWGQVDLDGGYAMFDKTKSGRPHCVPFGPYARSILERRKGASESPWVFPASKTGRTTRTKTHIKQTKSAEAKVSAESGVDFTAHDLRRTSASLLGEAGVGVYAIKAALNHAAAAKDVTERHYMRIRLKALRSVFERLESAILEEVGVSKRPEGIAELLEIVRERFGDKAITEALLKLAGEMSETSKSV